MKSSNGWLERGLDVSRLQESSGCDRAFEAELLELYIQGCSSHLEPLPKVLREGKKKDAHFHVHSVKGSSAQLGASKVVQYCLDLEKNLADCKEGSKGDDSVKGLEKKCQGLTDVYNEYVKTMRDFLKTH